jgi:hypothetical protein
MPPLDLIRQRLQDKIEGLEEALLDPPNEGDALYFREQLETARKDLASLQAIPGDH